MKSKLALSVIFTLINGTIFGTATTHIWAPSTDVQPFMKFHITSDIYIPIEKTNIGVRFPPVTNIGLTVGVLPFKNINMEVGLDHKAGLWIFDDYPLYFNTKLGTPEDGLFKYMPALAAGIYDVGTKSEATDFNMIYGKIAKSFVVGKFPIGRFSAGYFSGNKALLRAIDGSEDNKGFLFDWERTMAEISDKLWICVEYMGSKSVYGSLNIGASWKFADNVGVLAGYDIYNEPAFPGTATLQVDIDF